MKPFTKQELWAIAIIFAVLVAISVPNFIKSIVRARDQVRKDDMGVMMRGLEEYKRDLSVFPAGTPDGRIVACKNPGDEIRVDSKGHLIVNLIPCDWGYGSLVNMTPGSARIYVSLLPRDPNFDKGAQYMYYSDGIRYELLVHLEDKSDAEYDPVIEARHVMCGKVVCNAGRVINVPKDKSIEEYDKELSHQK